MSEPCKSCSLLTDVLMSRVHEAYAVRDRAREASNRDLKAKRQAEQAMNLEPRVASWVRGRLGPEHMARQERAVRLLEEAIELAQAEGVDPDLVRRLVEHVYSRPAGMPKAEIAGVATTAVAYCAAAGLNFWRVAVGEVEQLEQLPDAVIRASLRRKEAAGLLTVRLRQHQPMEYDAAEGRRCS